MADKEIPSQSINQSNLAGTHGNPKKGYPPGTLQTSLKKCTVTSKDFTFHTHYCPIGKGARRCCLLKQNNKRIHRKDLFLKLIHLQNSSTELQFSPSGFEPLHIKLGTRYRTIKWCCITSPHYHWKDSQNPPPKHIRYLNKNSKEKKQVYLFFANSFWCSCKVNTSHFLFCLHHLLPLTSSYADWSTPHLICMGFPFLTGCFPSLLFL